MNNNAHCKISLGELFSKTCSIFRDNFKAIILVHLIVYIPYNIINFYLLKIGETSSFKILFDIMQFVINLFTAFATLATVYIVDNALQGRPPMSLRPSMNLAYKRWGASIPSGILMFIIALLLILLFVIPGIIWMVYYMFLYQVIALTDLKGKNALDYSKYVVKGDWWKVSGYFLALSSIPSLIYFGGVFRFYKYLIAADPELKILSIPTFTISDALFSFSTVGLTILYTNLEGVKSESGKEIAFYEKVNRMINRDTTEDLQNEDDEMDIEIDDEDENALRCSVCGIKADKGQLICAVCHSIIKYDKS